MAEDESHSGTMISIILVVVALLVLLWFNNAGAFANVKEVFLKTSNPEDVKKIMEKELEKEKLEEQKLQENIKKISEFFIKQMNENDRDCIKEINLDEIKNIEDFNVRFRKNGFDVIKGNELWVEPFVLNQQVSYIKEGIQNNEESFSITDEFSKINDKISLGNFLYKGQEKIYFLDLPTSLEFSGKYSTVFAKKKCDGEPKKEINKLKLNLIEGSLEPLNTYLDKPTSDIILHLGYLSRYIGTSGVHVQIRQLYENRFRESNLKYFNGNYKVGCWRLVVSYKNRNPLVYGGLNQGDTFDRSVVETIDESTGFGKVAEVALLLSTSEGCRKV